MNREHYERLKRDVGWNRWRRENPDIIPDLSNANLDGINLSGANLANAYLRRSYLSEANLSNTNLKCANLSQVDARWTDFKGANIDCTNFEGADLTGADLTGAKMSEAYFKGAYLYNAIFNGASVSGKNFLTDTEIEGTYYSISISQIKDGWIVLVGCEIYLFDRFSQMSEALALYIDNPEKARKKYIGGEK